MIRQIVFTDGVVRDIPAEASVHFHEGGYVRIEWTPEEPRRIEWVYPLHTVKSYIYDREVHF